MSAILIVVIVCLICFTVLLSTSMICETIKQDSSKIERRVKRLENITARLEEMEEARRRELHEKAAKAAKVSVEMTEIKSESSSSAPTSTVKGIYVGPDRKIVEVFR